MCPSINKAIRRAALKCHTIPVNKKICFVAVSLRLSSKQKDTTCTHYEVDFNRYMSISFERYECLSVFICLILTIYYPNKCFVYVYVYDADLDKSESRSDSDLDLRSLDSFSSNLSPIFDHLPPSFDLFEASDLSVSQPFPLSFSL